MLTFDEHVPRRANLGFQHRVLFEPSHQHAGPPVDKPGGQPLMQRVRQPILYRAGAFLPMERIAKPVRAVGRECPRAYVCNAVGEGVDVAIRTVREGDLALEPVVWNRALFGQKAVDRHHQFGVVRGGDLAVVGHLADVPEKGNPLAAGGERCNRLVARHAFERFLVDGRRRADQPFAGRQAIEARLEACQRGEVEIAVSPLHGLHGVEAVALQRLDQRILHRLGAPGDAEGAVAHVAAGAAGDLTEFGGRQAAELEAVELALRSERDVIDVEVQAHADGVGGDQKLDVAGLEQFDLGVARARAQRTEHDRRAAALAADQFGDGVNLVGREGDDRRAARQAGDLARAGVGEERHARAGHHVHARQQLLDDAAHRGGAEEQRLVAAAQVQQAVGEDVAALKVAGELDLVDGKERHVGRRRHRLDGADAEARRRGDDLLLAGDERDLVGTDALRHAAVNLAGEEAERQADHARGVRQHPLDGEMGLARVGGAEDGDDVAAAGVWESVIHGRRHDRSRMSQTRTFCRVFAGWRGRR